MFSILTFILLVPTSYFLEGKPQPEPQGSRCSEFSDFGYFCVPFFQCDDDSNIITDGRTLFDPRVSDIDCNKEPEKSVATTSSCRKLTERCCFHPNYTDTCNNIKPTKKTNTNTGGNRNTNTNTNRNCGKRNPNGVLPTITALQLERDATKFGEWPHVCALLEKQQYKDQELKRFRCGASLIEGGVVLTAAHCLLQPSAIEPEALSVRCGEWDTGEEDQLPFQERDVTTVQIHPCYNNDNLHHDVALLFLRDKFQEEPHISPVCLPQPGTVWPGECVSNGWGKDKFGADGKYATVLKEVTLPLVDRTECQNLLKNTRLGPFFELDKSFMCAGGQDKRDTCKGDGGSPLTCELDGFQVQAGIVSWGIGCGEVGVPAVYTDVAAAACWIDGHVRCFYGDENSPSAFGFSSGVCPRRRCEDLDKIQCD